MPIYESLLSPVKVFSTTIHYLRKAEATPQKIETYKQAWAKNILQIVNLQSASYGTTSPLRPLILVGNHISYLDIPLLLTHCGHLSFVAKAELLSWPIFGNAAKKANTVFVKRESTKSRSSAKTSILEAIKQNQSIVIFPSGTTCVSESKPWKLGAFKIAKESNCLIQPFRISYSPSRIAAYVDNDFFPTHLLKVCQHKGLFAKIEFHEPVKVQDPMQDCKKWYEWTRESSYASNH